MLKKCRSTKVYNSKKRNEEGTTNKIKGNQIYRFDITLMYYKRRIEKS